jgi:hypothetical protein
LFTSFLLRWVKKLPRFFVCMHHEFVLLSGPAMWEG